MIDRIPRRVRVAFSRPEATPAVDAAEAAPEDRGEVDFVAYGEDCVLFGRTILNADRLSDMLNNNDEYVLAGVTVERFDGEPPMTVDEIAIPRDELLLVHAGGPRGDARRRHRTAQQHIAIQIGRYKVRGFYHALPGTDPVLAMRRRRPMIPLTNARIQYLIGDEMRESRVEALIVNRDQIDWFEAVEPDRAEFPVGPKRVAVHKA